MNTTPMVSAIIIFLNGERFLAEAVESVLAQTYAAWELLLVDDGSTDGSTAIAQAYARRLPEQIRYLEHATHENRGMSASRNLGIQHARGQYVAFLDSDDVWLPRKLTEQVALLEAHPDAAMLYSSTEYWFDWTGSPADAQRNFLPELGLTPDMVYDPPSLLPGYILGTLAVPGTCSLLVRRDALTRIGGFEAAFRTMYEDQAFYAKMSLEFPIYVSGNCWDRYRQHSASASADDRRQGTVQASRTVFLDWLAAYVEAYRGPIDTAPVRRAVRRARWLNTHPRAAKWARRGRRLAKLIRLPLPKGRPGSG